MTHPPFLIVITDVDGTLLDHDSYSSEAAREGLDALARSGVPIVLCSSKTQAEILALQRQLAIRHPFISENGGALFIPHGYFPMLPNIVRRLPGGDALEFGSPYRDVIEALHLAAVRLHTHVIGFNDMSEEEVASMCGLPLARARLAKMREYDEPFRILNVTPGSRARLRAALHVRGFRHSRGGRFDHVTGPTDKGVPLTALRNLYERNVGGPVLTVGFGDSPNDIPMLSKVDIPIVVRNRRGGGTARLMSAVPAARVTARDGGAGWSAAVKGLLVGMTGPCAGVGR